MPRITPQEAVLERDYNALHDGLQRLQAKLPEMSDMNAARAQRSIENIRTQMHSIDAKRMRLQNLRAVS